MHRLYNPESITQYNIVPGLMGVILTMTLVMMTGLAITRERERGTMENLLAMPLTPLEVMTGKIVPYIAIGLVQASIILLAARFIFSVPFVGSITALYGASLLFIACQLTVGITLSSLAQNQLQAMQFTFFYFLPNILLSGFMFPFRGMPEWAQWIGSVLPLTYFNRIVRGILLKGNDWADLWPSLWPLAGVRAGGDGDRACGSTAGRSIDHRATHARIGSRGSPRARSLARRLHGRARTSARPIRRPSTATCRARGPAVLPGMPARARAGARHPGRMVDASSARRRSTRWCGRALAASPTLDAGARAARAGAGAAQRAHRCDRRIPQVDATFGADRQRIDPATFGFPEAPNPGPVQRVLRSAPTCRTTSTSFGGTRRELEALAAEVDYQGYELEAARLTLADATSSTTAIRRAALAAQIDATRTHPRQRSVAQLAIVEQRYETGGVALLDVQNQRALVAQTEATLAPLRAQWAQAGAPAGGPAGRARPASAVAARRSRCATSRCPPSCR